MIYRNNKGLVWASVSIPAVLIPVAWWLGLVLLAAWAYCAWRTR